ncbi:IS3 family transposase [Sebaldella sp. S0638]|uniref:IS3 family transposase n=1 Tax=Sebaldella sp. S0638 TaxID=2957809 RepID=UPI0020A21D9A|nr:IS3 family transposase [Sebaldella sp. S0638]MCP1226253.1 IS3 family transposase [Sebaldella sp. S0638]
MGTNNKKIFKDNRNNYGTRKIKIELSKLKYIVSRRKISIIMENIGLVSSYTKASYKPVNMKIPENETDNLLNRKFKSKNPLEILVSDFTYIRVNSKWSCICLFVDIFNRQIVEQCRKKKECKISIQSLSRNKRKCRQ